MKKLTIFLLLSLALTKAFSQDVDSIKMEFNKLMKDYIDKNNGNTIQDIVRAEDDVWMKKGFWIFRHNEKVHVEAIYGPNHGKLDEAKEVDYLRTWSEEQAQYLKEVTAYLQKTNPGLVAYVSHNQTAKQDKVPDSALSRPRENLLKTEVITEFQEIKGKNGKPKKSSKELAEEAFNNLLESPAHKALIDDASSKFGTAVILLPQSPEVVVNYTETDFDGNRKEGVRIEKRTGDRIFTLLVVCNF
jgi:hypothetical protein